MCTVSAHFDQNGLVVNMNRDEQRARHEGQPFVSNNMLYPVDAKLGGTWVGANEQGVVMCLLNLYERESFFTGSQTRGNIIPKLLALGTFEKITQYLNGEFQSTVYSAFSLLVFHQKTVFKARWDGQVFSVESNPLSPWYFFTSSGLDSVNVQAGRRKLFESWLIGEQNSTDIPSIHLKFQKDNEPSSCFVQRDLVHTKSICQIKVTQTQVGLHYYPNSVLSEAVNSKTIESGQSQTFVLNKTN